MNYIVHVAICFHKLCQSIEITYTKVIDRVYREIEKISGYIIKKKINYEFDTILTLKSKIKKNLKIILKGVNDLKVKNSIHKVECK